ncbi:MAG: undecaprenyl-diphosphate phosphatase [Thalassobaculum sp.]|uniref:undecaprenyl-diphosphate phosphatase n=1 Tax=Thalassobaculum sp. TaxID=2022740 RepID=UPI0032EB9ABF
MSIEQLIVLAVVQGITEFLPISSSGHLILVPYFTGEVDQGLMIDVALHVGTLGAVMLYLWRDIARMLVGLGRMLRGRADPGARLALQLVVATLPLVAAGYAASRYLGDTLRSVEVIGWATLGFGIVLWLVDRAGMTVRRIEHLSYGGALFIGCSQILALIPGTSRSGITMTAARLLGFERAEAARFSMLLSIPAIVASGSLQGLKLYQTGNEQLTVDAFVAAGLALVAALIAIVAMMGWLRRASFLPFVLYRIALGGGLLIWLYFG